MLEVRSVTRMFGQKAAVDNVSFSIDGPAFVGIIGRSGAGKSTFLRLMNRLIDASSGEILVDGQNVLALKGAQSRAWQSQCAMIFQQFNLVPRMDVASNVLHGILNRRSTLSTMFNFWPDDDVLKELDMEAFDLTGLYDGVPLTEKSNWDVPQGPDTVYLFRRPIIDEWAERGNVTMADLVAHVTIHEFAHHFGWSDDDIAAIDQWWH